MTNKEAAIWLREHIDATPDGTKQSEAIELAIKALEKIPEWIPVKWHEITEEEREREGYPEEWITHLDCLMPDDEQEILITVKGSKGSRWVEKDTALIDDGHYLDSGYDWVDDAIAWMPLPEPWETESEEKDADSD